MLLVVYSHPLQAPPPSGPGPHRVYEWQYLLCVLEQQVVVDLGGQAQQVTQREVLVNGPLNGAELVQDELIGDVAAAACSKGKTGPQRCVQLWGQGGSVLACQQNGMCARQVA